MNSLEAAKAQDPGSIPSKPTALSRTSAQVHPSHEEQKSFCKVKGHAAKEIVFACYECKDTYCYGCLDAHRGHRLIYFNAFLDGNYEQVTQMNKTPASPPDNSTEPVQHPVDIYKARCKFTQENVLIKVFKEFK